MRAAGVIVTLLFVASEAIPLLLYANRRSICLVDVTQPQVNSSTIVNGLEDAAAVDFVYESGVVYWTDVSQEAVKRSWLDGSRATENVVNHGLVSPDGLACDWIGKKIYWTDSETNRIEVSNLDGSFRKVLFWERLDQPRAIAVDPLRGYVYWTDWGETAKIERAGMDGSAGTRQTLVSTEIAWPNGLTIDYDAGRIYWTDGKLKYIHSCKLDGSDRHPIVRNSLQHPYAITVFGDLLYWTDWQMRNIYACNKSSGEGQAAVISNLFSPMDVRVFHAGRQPHGHNPCGSNNGGCSHLCLISPEFPYYRCACPTGIKQLPDNKTCAHEASEILLLARRTDLCWISLDTPDFTDVVVPLESIRHAIAVDYDPVDGLVYWTDDEARSIRRTNLNATREEVIIEGSISNPEGIAVDWIARNLYWTDSGTDRIEVSRLNGTSRKVLIATDLDEPRAIVVHPVRGLLFWTDWGAAPKIERSNLDGSDRKVLVNTSVGWPNGLSIDHAAEKIYWADAKTDRIEVANFDGSTRITLVSDKLPHVFGVSLLGEYLYWTDWQDCSIQRVHKSTGQQRRTIVEHLTDLMGLKAVNVRVPEGSNECSYNNGNCSHLCLNRPAPKGHVCACPMGQELLADGKTCIVPEAFLLYSHGIDIRRVSLEGSHKLSYGVALVPVPGVKTVRAIDFDVRDDRVYWTDVALKSISRAFVNGSSLERLIEFGLETPDGLAIDWVAQNMYWTDSGTRRIEMSRLNGSSQKAIVWIDVIPVAIAVDPPNGYLYWSNWMGKPHIERSYLDGSRRQTIAADVGNVAALTVDYDSQRLYWINVDRKLMESSKLGGSDRRPVITGIPHSMGITQYDRFIFWTNTEARIIEKADKTTGQNRTTVLGQLDFVTFVTSLSAFHSSRQTGWNECQVNNGGCSHLCIAHSPDDRIPRKGDCTCPNHRDFRSANVTCRCALHCACPTHYTLAPDNATCQKPSSFLLYSRHNSTSRVLVGGEDNLEVVLPIHDMNRIRAIEYDPINSFIYWIDDGAKGIYRIRDNGSDFSHVIGPGLAMQNGPIPYDLAIDPYARMLYWSDSSSNVISVSRLDGTGIGVIVREGQPRSIALAPEDGYLFWTSTAKVPKIKSSHLDGTTVSTLFSTGLGSLGAITVDVQSQKLFWVDLDLTKIECSDFGGGNRQTLVDDELLSEPSGLAVFGNYLYWVDQPTKSLERVNKTNGRGHVRIVSGESEITDLVVVARSKTDLRKSPCGNMNGGCSHLCVVDKNAKNSERRCSCPMGLQLANDDHTCESPPTCNPDHFTCANGLCIPAAWQCDGFPECTDGSDESNCSSRCSSLQFRCNSGQCVQRKQRCDGTKNCNDGSDEKNCPPCDTGQKMCIKDEVCISAAKWCNKRVDCSDKSDESNCGDRRTSGHSGPATTMPYAIGIGIVGSIIIVVVFLVLIVCLCRQKSRMLAVVDDRYKIVLVAKLPNMLTSQCSDSATRVTQVCCSQQSVTAQPVLENADAESTLYDRDNLTGASSTSSSLVAQYPQDLLNPPPSPATERSSRAIPSMYYISKAKRAGKTHGLRPHRRPRKHVPPPPTTPCSTDVCDDSDPCSLYRWGPFSPNADFGYESDLLCPPPPTPQSHYLSGDLDIGCLPSTENSYILPYLPPSSPPASVFSCSDS